jgi:hypothetical protein
MPEGGLSPSEVAKEIAEHRERAEHGEAQKEQPAHSTRHDVISIVEAVILSLVALLAAWSGYSAAKWGTHASLSLARASSTRTRASLTEVQANQIRTLDSVSFNAVATALASGNKTLFRVTVRRLRPGYRPAFNAWLATHPLTNPNAPPGPAYMPQYRIPQDAQADKLNAQADAYFSTGESAAQTSDKYVRLTVILAAVLFLIGIGSRFPFQPARYGLIGVAGLLLVVSAVELLGLPGPPA